VTDDFRSWRFHHIGVVTADLEASITFYERLDYTSSERCADPLQQIQVVLLRRAGDPLIELIAPNGPASTASSWTERLKAGPYHTCYEVDDMDEAVKDLRLRHLAKVFGPAPAAAFGMRRIVFLWGASSGLIELIEASTPQ